MAKTRFNKDKINSYLSWMMSQYDAKHAGSLDKSKAKAIAAANLAIREKYPESDMVLLRKYTLNDTDNCLKFVDKNDAIFGFTVATAYQETVAGVDVIADLPYKRGCRNNDVFKISMAGRKAIEDYINARGKAKDDRDNKRHTYYSFLLSCRNVEDAHQVVPLPEDMLKKLLCVNSTAMIAFNPDVLRDIKKEFEVKNQ